MSRFRKSERHQVPSLSTASLPDLIFTLLFFFMIVTNTREDEPKMKLRLPDATEVRKLEQKNRVLFIYIGLPDSAGTQKTGNHPLIQINNELVAIHDIPSYIDKRRAGLSPEERESLVASLKIDKDIRMGIVTDVKQVLRESNVVTINYVAEEEKNNERKD